MHACVAKSEQTSGLNQVAWTCLMSFGCGVSGVGVVWVWLGRYCEGGASRSLHHCACPTRTKSLYRMQELPANSAQLDSLVCG